MGCLVQIIVDGHSRRRFLSAKRVRVHPVDIHGVQGAPDASEGRILGLGYWLRDEIREAPVFAASAHTSPTEKYSVMTSRTTRPRSRRQIRTTVRRGWTSLDRFDSITRVAHGRVRSPGKGRAWNRATTGRIRCLDQVRPSLGLTVSIRCGEPWRAVGCMPLFAAAMCPHRLLP